MSDIELQGWVEGPRWAGFADFIEQTAMACGLRVVSIRERKSFLFATVYYTVRGERARINVFKRARDRVLAEYNEEVF